MMHSFGWLCEQFPNNIAIVTSAEFVGIDWPCGAQTIVYTGKVFCTGYQVTNTYGGARCASDEIHACVAVPAKFADDYWSSSTNGRLDLIKLIGNTWTPMTARVSPRAQRRRRRGGAEGRVRAELEATVRAGARTAVSHHYA